MRARDEFLASVVIGLGIFALLAFARLVGLADGVMLGSTPASGLALGGAVLFGGRAALASGLAFAAADLVFDLSPAVAAVDGLAHALAAASGAALIGALVRRRHADSFTNDWLFLLAGACAFTSVVAIARMAGVPLGLTPGASTPLEAVALTTLFKPLGLLTVCAALFSFREWRLVVDEPQPAFVILALATTLLGVLGLLLALPQAQISPSGWTLMLAVPFCLWIAMEPRSLDGAVLSMLAVNVALTFLVLDAGSILALEFVTAVLYLNLLVVTCQFVHAVNRDRLSALAEVETRKLELEARVADRTAELTAMTEKAVAADAAKSHLLATVSHEIRTPLTGVLGMTSLVLSADLDAETRRKIELIQSSGFHLLDVINRILDYSHVERGSSSAPASDFDVRELVEAVLTEARFLPYARGLTLRADVDPALATRRRGDRRGLRQILTNLVGNAAKFTDAGGVTVRLAEAQGRVRFEVADTGAGVPLADQTRIFRAFERTDISSAISKGGSGLGLAICTELVQRMGGRIGVVSAPGEGSTFWFEIPLARADRQRAPSVRSEPRIDREAVAERLDLAP